MPQRQRRWPRVIGAAAFACLAIVANRNHPSRWWLAIPFVLAALWCAFPQVRERLARSAQDLGTRLRLRRARRALAARARKEAGLRVGPDGLAFVDTTGVGVVPWSEIVQVNLRWEENPWEHFAEFSWEISTQAGRTHVVDDSDVNRCVLLPALASHLPGYAFVHQGFNPSEAKGSVVCWKRSS